MRVPEIEYLEKLVAIPSISGGEARIAEFARDECAVLGHHVLTLGNNVLVRIPGEDSTKAFIANGHLDTVPPTDEWTSNPFDLQPDQTDPGKLVGLGSSDMKSGDAIMLGIAERGAEGRPPCDVWLMFTDREEVEGSGAERATEWFSAEARHRYKTIGGVILEPTNASFVGVGSRGDAVWHATAGGPGGHASQEFVGERPSLERIYQLGAALPDIRARWLQYADPLLGPAVINATTTHAGVAHNTVPQNASATFNLRVTPTLLPELSKFRDELEQTYDVRIKQSWEPRPTLCDSDSAIYKAAQMALAGANLEAFPGATDQCFFQAQDIPVLIYGPGTVKVMHEADEWVEAKNIISCSNDISRLIDEFSKQND